MQMKKKYILLVLLILNMPVILLAGEISGKFKLIQAMGFVNRDEIGAGALTVVSFWADKPALVCEGGSFTTVISNQRPQKLFLFDAKKNLRALAIASPRNCDNIIFDARSTAIGVLFQDASSFGQSLEVENFCSLLDEKQSFQSLVLFLKNNLPAKPVNELIKHAEYAVILDRCNSEIFGNDPRTITNSLETAQKQLQKILQ